MAGYRRAARPLNTDAAAAANAAVAADTGGRRIRPGETALRKKWMDAYEAAGGKVKTVGPSGTTPKTTSEPCPVPKTVTARIVSVTFRSDHLDSAGKKLLKRARPDPVTLTRYVFTAQGRDEVQEEYTSYLGNLRLEYEKPEWSTARGGDADSHPISHTKNLPVKVDLVVEFKVEPAGQTAALTEVSGTSVESHLTFGKPYSKTVGTQKVTIRGLVAQSPLPDWVDLIETSIDWSVVADGETISIGSTSHTIYVTLDKPGGQMDSYYQVTGRLQHVTDQRLAFSVKAVKDQRLSDEKECVDALFKHINNLGVGYRLGFGWPNETGVDPRPSLHHYLWLCNHNKAMGECHVIASAFILACQILGVKGRFEVGYMYPRTSRAETPPSYPKQAGATLGIYTTADGQYRRTHSGESHGREILCFVDGRGGCNNFEGVARYGEALYAIGDARFDLYGTANANAASYFAKRRRVDWGTADVDLTRGCMSLVFIRTGGSCQRPYPWMTTARSFYERRRNAAGDFENVETARYVVFLWES